MDAHSTDAIAIEHIKLNEASRAADAPLCHHDPNPNVNGDGANATSIPENENGQVTYPPTISDILQGLPEPTSNALQKTAELFSWIKTRPTSFRNDLQAALYERQLVRNLPPRTASSAHVYVVTYPHIPREVSTRHWSVYSQGYFYHLSTRRRPNNHSTAQTQQSDASSRGEKAVGAGIYLKVEDFSAVAPGDLLEAERGLSRTPFVAYEMGSTAYAPPQLYGIAQAIIAELATYDLLKANCQVFAIQMIERVVMFRRDCAVFVGTKAQLANWDLLRGRGGGGSSNNNNNDDDGAQPPPHHHPNHIDQGFLIRKPIARRPRWSPRTRQPFFILFPVPGVKLRAARNVYKERPSAFAYTLDPRGEHGMLTWGFVRGMREPVELVRVAGRCLRRAVRELGEVVVAGWWRDALLGRAGTKEEFRVLGRRGERPRADRLGGGGG